MLQKKDLKRAQDVKKCIIATHRANGARGVSTSLSVSERRRQQQVRI